MRRISQCLILILMWQMMTSMTLLANKSYNLKGVASKTTLTTNSIVKPNLQIQKDTLITVHSPKLNGGGTVEGSIRILLGESFNVNGAGMVTGDIYVPGTPEIKTNSNLTYQGTVVGNGKEQPSNYIIKLNGNSTVNRIVTRTDAIEISSVPTVAQGKGTRDVALIEGDKTGDFSTIRDLTLTKWYNLLLEVPEGTYGNFIAHRRSGFILGVDNRETTYNLQSLELNSNTVVKIRGKVTINIKNSLVLNSNSRMGDANKARNLSVNIENGGVTLNSSTQFYGTINAPSGTLTLNSNSKLVGLVICDRANLNSNSLLKTY